MTRNEVVKKALLTAQRDGYNQIILYNEKSKDYVIVRDFDGNQETWSAVGYNIVIGKVKTHYDNGVLKAIFISNSNKYFISNSNK